MMDYDRKTEFIKKSKKGDFFISVRAAPGTPRDPIKPILFLIFRGSPGGAYPGYRRTKLQSIFILLKIILSGARTG